MRLRPARIEDQDALATTHQACFAAAAWPADELAGLLTGPGGFGVVVEAPSAAIAGLVLCRSLAGEAEILTLAVDPDHRRAGLGRALVEAACGLAQAAGAGALFLEVAADNAAAISLYEATAFERVGLRRSYYSKGRPTPVDALVYRRALTPAPVEPMVIV